jgi:hypothetical protein
MHSNHKTAAAEELSLLESETDNVEEKTLNEYKELNEKCDKVITKIKTRKEKKTQAKK